MSALGDEAGRGPQFAPRARVVALALAAGAALGAPAPARGATPIERVHVSADVTVVLGGTTTGDEGVVEDDLAGTVTPADLGLLPAAADVVAYHVLPGGDRLFAVESALVLPGGVAARPGDVIRFDGGAYSLELEAEAEGLPPGVGIDALSATASGALVVSFDTGVAVDGTTFRDHDLASWDVGSFAMFLDGEAAGIAGGLDVDAVHVLDLNGHLLVSFDTGGSVGGVSFDDEDVLELDPVGGGWELAYDGGALHPAWSPGDLDAVFVPPLLNTPEGDGVTVEPRDETTGDTPVSVSFAQVTGAGTTSLRSSDTGTPPPFGFQTGEPPTFYELSTTAEFAGPVTVCLSYAGISYVDETELRLFHFEDTDGDGTGDDWVDRTISLDTDAQLVCASVESFSLFAAFEPSIDEAAFCSFLGDRRRGHGHGHGRGRRFRHFLFPDLDLFTLEGSAGERLAVELQAAGDDHRGERATLLLKDRIRRVHLAAIDRSALPNALEVELPAGGEYWLIVSQQARFAPGRRFSGGYCVLVTSDQGAARTLQPTRWVE